MSELATHIPEKHQKLFDEMLKRFNISAKRLAQETEISEGMISRFRQGKSDFTTANLITLLFNVPEEARIWYLSELFDKTSFRQLITRVSHQERIEILKVINELYMLNNHETTGTLNPAHTNVELNERCMINGFNKHSTQNQENFVTDEFEKVIDSCDRLGPEEKAKLVKHLLGNDQAGLSLVVGSSQFYANTVYQINVVDREQVHGILKAIENKIDSENPNNRSSEG
jgi:transcriptional regulator with XRE-family HTH domain